MVEQIPGRNPRTESPPKSEKILRILTQRSILCMFVYVYMHTLMGVLTLIYTHTHAATRTRLCTYLCMYVKGGA